MLSRSHQQQYRWRLKREGLHAVVRKPSAATAKKTGTWKERRRSNRLGRKQQQQHSHPAKQRHRQILCINSDGKLSTTADVE